eukprot:TRINITY_DN1333_c1_g1_i1.p1 TRINITY_DN1333_c1_g1~~TRINITY_DN1333_c1_g1_i1.p1  ORF type:complete len:2228 (+),score=681.47 TRINITY_DN1333_c1_g1_i1:938-6685(+)
MDEFLGQGDGNDDHAGLDDGHYDDMGEGDFTDEEGGGGGGMGLFFGYDGEDDDAGLSVVEEEDGDYGGYEPSVIDEMQDLLDDGSNAIAEINFMAAEDDPGAGGASLRLPDRGGGRGRNDWAHMQDGNNDWIIDARSVGPVGRSRILFPGAARLPQHPLLERALGMNDSNARGAGGGGRMRAEETLWNIIHEARESSRNLQSRMGNPRNVASPRRTIATRILNSLMDRPAERSLLSGALQNERRDRVGMWGAPNSGAINFRELEDPMWTDEPNAGRVLNSYRYHLNNCIADATRLVQHWQAEVQKEKEEKEKAEKAAKLKAEEEDKEKKAAEDAAASTADKEESGAGKGKGKGKESAPSSASASASASGRQESNSRKEREKEAKRKESKEAEDAAEKKKKKLNTEEPSSAPAASAAASASAAAAAASSSAMDTSEDGAGGSNEASRSTMPPPPDSVAPASAATPVSSAARGSLLPDALLTGASPRTPAQQAPPAPGMSARSRPSPATPASAASAAPGAATPLFSPLFDVGSIGNISTTSAGNMSTSINASASLGSDAIADVLSSINMALAPGSTAAASTSASASASAPSASAPSASASASAPSASASASAPAPSTSSTTTTATTSAPAGANAEPSVPEGIDPEVLAALPPDIREEVLRQNAAAAAVERDLDTSESAIDPEYLAALPPDMQREVLAQERRERERERSARAAAAASASAAGTGDANTSAAGNTSAAASEAQEMDNASFIASLNPTLRREVLAGADDAFIATLPPNLRSEALAAREQFGITGDADVPRFEDQESEEQRNQRAQMEAVLQRRDKEVQRRKALEQAAARKRRVSERLEKVITTVPPFLEEKDVSVFFRPTLFKEFIRNDWGGRGFVGLFRVLVAHPETRIHVVQGLISSCEESYSRHKESSSDTKGKGRASTLNPQSTSGPSSAKPSDPVAGSLVQANPDQADQTVRRRLLAVVSHLVSEGARKSMVSRLFCRDLPVSPNSTYLRAIGVKHTPSKKGGKHRQLTATPFCRLLALISKPSDHEENVTVLALLMTLAQISHNLTPSKAGSGDNNAGGKSSAAGPSTPAAGSRTQASGAAGSSSTTTTTPHSGSRGKGKGRSRSSSAGPPRSSRKSTDRKGGSVAAGKEGAGDGEDDGAAPTHSIPRMRVPPVLLRNLVDVFQEIPPARKSFSAIVSFLSLCHEQNKVVLENAILKMAKRSIEDCTNELKEMRAVYQAASAGEPVSSAVPPATKATAVLGAVRSLVSLELLRPNNPTPLKANSLTDLFLGGKKDAVPRIERGNGDAVAHFPDGSFCTLPGTSNDPDGSLAAAQVAEIWARQQRNSATTVGTVASGTASASGSKDACDTSDERPAEPTALPHVHKVLQPVLESLWEALDTTLAALQASPLKVTSGKSRRLTGLTTLLEAFFLLCAPPPPSTDSGNDQGLVSSVKDIAISDSPPAAASSTQAAGSSTSGAQAKPSSVGPGGTSDGTESEAESKFFAFADKHRVVINMIIRESSPSPLSAPTPFLILMYYPRMLEFDIKRNIFKIILRKQTSRLGPSSLRLNLRREHIFEDSFHQLRRRSPEEMRGRLNVQFVNEMGVDAGGLAREWFLILSREIFNPNYALFKSSAQDDVTFQPNRLSYYNPDHLSYFKFVGRIIGKAVLDDFMLDCHFTRSFYKHILGQKVSFEDMQALDPDYYKSLKWILENDIEGVLDLTFTTEADRFGTKEEIELKPNGANIPVTNENKEEYVALITENRTTTAIKQQLEHFLEGFHELIPRRLVSMFDPSELELLISGLPDIDIDDLRVHTEYGGGYNQSSPVIRWFWEVVSSFTNEEKAKLLQYVTGTSKVPLEGFAALKGMSGPQKFQIHKTYTPTSHLPTAHTCFNQLDLPVYTSRAQLKDRLMLALTAGSAGFGFV